MPNDLNCSQIVIITHWGRLPASKSLSRRRYKSHGTLRITAIVYGKGENGLISNTLAEKLQIPDEKQAIKAPSVFWISWTFDGPGQNLETSEVHIVPELKQDLILGDNTDILYQSVHLSPPEARQLNTKEDFQKRGITTANEQSQDMLNYLLSLHRTKAQPNVPDSKNTESVSEEIKRPPEASSAESSRSLTLDSMSSTGSDGEVWTMDFGDSRQDLSFPRAPWLDISSDECGAYYNAAAHPCRTHFKHSAGSCDWEVVTVPAADSPNNRPFVNW
ncbi:hypothetical protein ACLX1H_008724 [Fusarium chlamydosporum]